MTSSTSQIVILGDHYLEMNSRPEILNLKNRVPQYNFDWDKSIYDSHDWSERKDGQPFFMQVQLHGGKLRGASAAHYEKFDEQVKGVFFTDHGISHARGKRFSRRVTAAARRPIASARCAPKTTSISEIITPNVLF